MCNTEDNGEKAPHPYNKKSLTGSKCVKCDAPGVLITRIHDAFCKSCFQVYVVHKFRSALGKSKLIRDGETVLVAYSGGTNSSALLHLIKDGLSHRTHKRLRFTPTLLHIDETCLVGNESSEWKENEEQVKKIMSDSGFPSYLTKLEQCFATDESGSGAAAEDCRPVDRSNENRLLLERLGQRSDFSNLPPTEESGKLRNLVTSLGNLTAQEDFIKNLRKQVLVLAARRLGLSKVLTAENSTRLAINILSDISQGRGSQVSLDTGISDERNGDIMFVRPVRELNAKELAMYNSLFGAESVFMPTLATKSPMASSIDRLTETFVTGLQADFPSTVSNIVRTSGKLGLPDMKGSDKCCFCQSPLDTTGERSSALGAVLFSQQLSRVSHAKADVQHQKQGAAAVANGEAGEGDQSSSGAASDGKSSDGCLDDLKETMCYGCRLSLHAFDGDLSILPSLITRTASIREKQKRQLTDFLLE